MHDAARARIASKEKAPAVKDPETPMQILKADLLSRCDEALQSSQISPEEQSTVAKLRAKIDIEF